MSRHAKTERLIATAVEILQAHRPMTVRQVYYQLVSRQVIENTRSARFVARHGDISVELGALPVDVLRRRIVGQVESRIDLDALAACRSAEDDEREQLRNILDQWGAP